MRVFLLNVFSMYEDLYRWLDKGILVSFLGELTGRLILGPLLLSLNNCRIFTWDIWDRIHYLVPIAKHNSLGIFYSTKIELIDQLTSLSSEIAFITLC